jgi:hypothetical protein
MIIKFIYTLFLGILFALFVGLGIAAFYPAPVAPKYPDKLSLAPASNYDEKTGSFVAAPESAETVQLRKEYEAQSTEYREVISPRYNRNVSIVSVIAAVLALVVSLTFMQKIDLISDGLLLGGVILLGYSIIRGFMSENNVLVLFMVTAAGLVAAVTVGYMKFVKTHEKAAK